MSLPEYEGCRLSAVGDDRQAPVKTALVNQAEGGQDHHRGAGDAVDDYELVVGDVFHPLPKRLEALLLAQIATLNGFDDQVESVTFSQEIPDRLHVEGLFKDQRRLVRTTALHAGFRAQEKQSHRPFDSAVVLERPQNQGDRGAVEAGVRTSPRRARRQ